MQPPLIAPYSSWRLPNCKEISVHDMYIVLQMRSCETACTYSRRARQPGGRRPAAYTSQCSQHSCPRITGGWHKERDITFEVRAQRSRLLVFSCSSTPPKPHVMSQNISIQVPGYVLYLHSRICRLFQVPVVETPINET